jgi:DNA polymerase-3 subunit delta'
MSYPWHKSELKGLLARKAQLPHAILLKGTQGIGKLSFAEALAQGLLCESPTPEGVACGRCKACGWAEKGGHPDLRRLEPASLAKATDADSDIEEGPPEKKEKMSSEILIKQVRATEDFINMTSHQGGMKVVLIHPAESLNVNAANALLKNLEEPPPRTCFVLVSHRWHRLLPTVRSRCQQVALPPPTPAAALAWLKEQGMSDAKLALAHAGGAPLLAAGFDEEYWTRRGQFLKPLAARGMNAMALAGQLTDEAPAAVVGWMQKWAYDIVCHQATGKVRYNPDFAAAIGAAAAAVEPVEAARYLRRMMRLQRIVDHPLNTRLFFEELLLSYAGLMKGRPVEMAA